MAKQFVTARAWPAFEDRRGEMSEGIIDPSQNRVWRVNR